MSFSDFQKWQRLTIPAAITALLAFYFIRYFIADELIAANNRTAALQQDLQTADKELEAEKANSTVARREADVMRRANALLRAGERTHQDEIAGLQSDLAFYRRLGGANGSQAALAVHHVELQPTQSPRVYKLIFTLTQNLRWAAVISGYIELGVDGIHNGVAEHLNEEQLLAGAAAPLNFQFKYFQQIERLITLPEGFAANRFSIHLKSGSLRTPVEQSMDWQALFNQSNTSPAEGEATLSTPLD